MVDPPQLKLGILCETTVWPAVRDAANETIGVVTASTSTLGSPWCSRRRRELVGLHLGAHGFTFDASRNGCA
jgi:hypothetical protein